jgi:hypothetical protein
MGNKQEGSSTDRKSSIRNDQFDMVNITNSDSKIRKNGE